jgi:hypothetical protein
VHPGNLEAETIRAAAQLQGLTAGVQMAEAHQAEVHPADQLAEALHPQAEGAAVEAGADPADVTAAPVRIQVAEEAVLKLIVDIAKSMVCSCAQPCFFVVFFG